MLLFLVDANSKNYSVQDKDRIQAVLSALAEIGRPEKKKKKEEKEGLGLRKDSSLERKKLMLMEALQKSK